MSLYKCAVSSETVLMLDKDSDSVNNIEATVADRDRYNVGIYIY